MAISQIVDSFAHYETEEQRNDPNSHQALFRDKAKENAKRRRELIAAGIKLVGACEEGDLAEVRRLLEMGAPVDQTNERGVGPLQAAMSRGHEAIMESLCEHGACPPQKEESPPASPGSPLGKSGGDGAESEPATPSDVSEADSDAAA